VLTAARTDNGRRGGPDGTATRPDSFTLTYLAGTGGTDFRHTRRRCSTGEDGTEVTAVPDTG